MAPRAYKRGDSLRAHWQAEMWITTRAPCGNLGRLRQTTAAAGARCITAFIFTRFPGFSTAQKLDKLGMRRATPQLVFLKTAKFRGTCW